MNKSFLLIFLIFCFIDYAPAQQKKLSLEELWSGAFVTKGMESIYPLKNGKHYTVLNTNKNTGVVSIDKYDYSTLEKIETVVTSQEIPSKALFSSYAFSADESKLLLATEVVPIYRRSKVGIYYIYDLITKEIIQIADTIEAKIADVGRNSITLEAFGDQAKINTILELFKPFGIKEIVRTGRIAMAKG